jgi:hypothetical protein
MFDLGKMFSGESKGGFMGGMLGGSVLNIVKGQLSSPKTRKMITTKVVEMAEHLAATFSAEDKEPIKKMYEKKANELKSNYAQKAEELTKKYGDNPTPEQKSEIENEIKGLYAKTQSDINELHKNTESRLNESNITKHDISILSTLKSIAVKNEKNEFLMIENKNGVMEKAMEEAIFIEIQVKGVTRKTLQLDEFLGTMMEQIDNEK